MCSFSRLTYIQFCCSIIRASGTGAVGALDKICRHMSWACISTRSRFGPKRGRSVDCAGRCICAHKYAGLAIVERQIGASVLRCGLKRHMETHKTDRYLATLLGMCSTAQLVYREIENSHGFAIVTMVTG